MRHAAAQLDALPRCREYDSGGQHRPRRAGAHLLVAELPAQLAAQAARPTSARLEGLARYRSRSDVHRREVLSLALVLELWRWRHDRSIHTLDRRGALAMKADQPKTA